MTVMIMTREYCSTRAMFVLFLPFVLHAHIFLFLFSSPLPPPAAAPAALAPVPRPAPRPRPRPPPPPAPAPPLPPPCSSYQGRCTAGRSCQRGGVVHRHSAAAGAAAAAAAAWLNVGRVRRPRPLAARAAGGRRHRGVSSVVVVSQRGCRAHVLARRLVARAGRRALPARSKAKRIKERKKKRREDGCKEEMENKTEVPIAT